MDIIIVCFIVFILSIIGVYYYYLFAQRKAIYDLPNERSSHTIPTPRGGGITIAVIWFLAISFFFLRKEIDSSLFFALLCGLPISIIGLIDDVISISPKARLFIQIASASMAIIFLGGFSSIDIGFYVLSIPLLFSIFAVIGIVWFTNLFNFLDGIDGYISVEVIFIGLAIFILSGAVLPLLLAAATAGFLVWNWQPAKIFMGDVGSTLLGFTLSVLAIYYQNNNDSSIVIWLMLTSLFWFDASLTLFRRWRNGETLSKAHKKHAYQRIVQYGFSHKKAVLFSILINISLIGIAWLAIKFPNYLLPLLGVNIVYLYLIMRLVDKRFPFPKTR